jgi:tetratricopeptide (TPR) repeat protein
MPDLSRAIELEPDNPVLWNKRGNLKAFFGRYFDAVLDFDQAIRLDRNYAEAFYNRGVTRIMNHDSMRGCEDLNRASDLGYMLADEKIRFFCGGPK